MLCASSNGVRIAHLVSPNGQTSDLQLNARRVVRGLLPVSGDARERPRLLGFHNEDVLVSASMSDGTSGVFLCGENRLRQVSKSEYVLEVRYTASGQLVLARSSTDKHKERRLIIPSLQTDIVVHDNSIVTGISSGRVLILDWIDGQLFRYLVGPQGFEDVSPVPVSPDDRVVGIVRWNGLCVLGVCTPTHSEIRFLGTGSWDLPIKTIEIEGELENLWQSPTQQTFAYLHRYIDGDGREIRRLMQGGTVVCSGLFTMGDNDLVWSPNGRTIGARMWYEGKDGKVFCMLASSAGSIKSTGSEYVIDDFCVNDNGFFTGWIIRDGRFHTPIILGRKHHTVVFAWNLRQIADGSVGYNRVIGDTVENVTVSSG